MHIKSIIAAVITIILMSCNPVYANDSQCTIHAKLAESTMHNRQLGIPLYQMMQLASEIKSKPVRDIVEYITVEAYEVPLYNSAEYKERAKSEFSNKIYKLDRKSVV